MLKPGDKAPDFSLPDANNNSIALSDFSGRWVVVYFYPKDDTLGCTKEACAFRDSYEDFKEAGAEVVGISSDSVESHKAFANRHKLPFTLLADEDRAVRKRWQVPNTLFFIQGRVTYVVDPHGVVQLVFNSQLNPAKHITEALAVINRQV